MSWHTGSMFSKAQAGARLEQALPPLSPGRPQLQGKSLGTGVCERGAATGLFSALSPPALPASFPSVPPLKNRTLP